MSKHASIHHPTGADVAMQSAAALYHRCLIQQDVEDKNEFWVANCNQSKMLMMSRETGRRHRREQLAAWSRSTMIRAGYAKAMCAAYRAGYAN